MEKIKLETIATLTPSNTDSIVFTLPAGFVSWTILVTPIDDEAGPTPDDPTVTLHYAVGGEFYPINPVSSPAVAKTNFANVITRSDAVAQVRVDLLNGAVPPNGGAVLELMGTRFPG